MKDLYPEGFDEDMLIPEPEDFRTNPETGERYCATCGVDLDEDGKCKCERHE